jgi:hypothetical protein
MNIVVISHNQPLEIPKFEEALRDFNHIYVIDRPTVEYPDDINAIYNYNGEGFLAGRMRDLGAINFPPEDILFLDGDKVPKGDLHALESMPFDCVLLGVENDPRDYFDGTTHRVNLPEDPMVQINGCYSCGILYRKELIRRFREINCGRIFHPLFDGTWGDEDSWNGDIMNIEGWNVGCTNEVVLSGEIGGCKINRNYVTPENIDDIGSKKMTDLGKLSQLMINFKKRCWLRKQVYNLE